MSTANQLPQRAEKRFIAFEGPISRQLTVNFRGGLCQLVNEGAKEITILFSSEGGSTDDGISLYTFLKALPVELTMHAIGLVKSIAIPLFLAAPNRYASQNARFYFHTYNWSTSVPETAVLTTLEERTLLIGDAVAWSKNIIQATTKLIESDFESMQLFKHPHIMTPARAADFGIISAITEPRMSVDAPTLVVG